MNKNVTKWAVLQQLCCLSHRKRDAIEFPAAGPGHVASTCVAVGPEKSTRKKVAI
jgi:hypothetical protein